MILSGYCIGDIIGYNVLAGITGTVSIDENGDRNADYSLLDMDPDSGKFQVITFNCGKF